MDLPNENDSIQDEQVNLMVPFPYVLATQLKTALFFQLQESVPSTGKDRMLAAQKGDFFWTNEETMNSPLHRRLQYMLEHLLQLTSYHIAFMKNSLLFWNPLAARAKHRGPKARLSFVRTEAK